MSIKVNGKKIAGIGIQGLPGKSAYDLAKEGGFIGTENDYKAQIANIGKITGQQGQMLTFDADGKPVASDMPLMTYISISNEAPTNTNYLWIDTADNSILKYYQNGVWISVGAVWK